MAAQTPEEATDLRLLVTDYDGTIFARGVALDEDARRELADDVRSLRARGGRWVVCTGRTFHEFRNSWHEMGGIGAHPDFVVVRHGRVYEWHDGEYFSATGLSWRCLIRNLRARRLARRRLHDERRALPPETARCAVRERRDAFSIRMPSADAADRVTEHLVQHVAPSDGLHVEARGTEVIVVTVSQSKAIAVRALQEGLGMTPDETVAVGDGLSDISLLDASVSRHVGCPANACGGVIQQVRRQHGHVASGGFLAGAVEVISAHADGDVDSEALQDRPTKATRLPVFVSDASFERMRLRAFLVDASLLCGVAYCTLLALSAMRAVPFGDSVMDIHNQALAGLLAIFGA